MDYHKNAALTVVGREQMANRDFSSVLISV